MHSHLMLFDIYQKILQSFPLKGFSKAAKSLIKEEKGNNDLKG